ncbi:MAG: hypothetical protein KDM91_10565 [Verrucomicrobiae bacterium]|nr:hypothetical protein [Verrucomicrobiae bacterium]MCP5542198.1 hypothetical protein [Akkermansiaceae bacterium]
MPAKRQKAGELVAVPADGSLDLGQTLDSGQVFHFETTRLGGIEGWAGCLGADPVFLAPGGEGAILTRARDVPAVRRFFQLDTPLAEIRATFPAADAVLEEAIAHCPGLRILRQPVWECLATFITSSLKQVVHIRRMSLALRRRFGRARRIGGRVVHAYPEPAALAAAGEAALRECGLGYRARGLHRTAEALASGARDLAELEGLDDAAARAWLMEFHGVGEKVANCVLLFGCGRHGAFPIDVWMDRVLRERYFGPRKRKRLTARELQRWAEGHFGPFAGHAQQYLFHFARKTF